MKLASFVVMERVNEDDINLFAKKKPFRWLIAGYSGSGKTTFVHRFISQYKSSFDSIYIYGTELEDGVKLGIIPVTESFNPLEEQLTGHTLILFDDCIFNKTILKIASEVYIRGRHKNISAIFISQNLFFPNDSFRSLSLNVTQLFLFTIRNVNQVLYFAKTFLSIDKAKKFVKLYERKVLSANYNYLMIDYSKGCNSPLRLRSNVLRENEEYIKVYVL